MADWKRIKTEYITSDISYRKLAEKYGLDFTTVAKRGRAEGWVDLRTQKSIKFQSKMTDAIIDKQVDRAANLISVADLLLEKVKNIVESDSEILMDTQSIKHLSSVLKDIKDVQMIRSNADMREQEARIENLRRQAEKADDDKDRTITVNIAGGEDSWQT